MMKTKTIVIALTVMLIATVVIFQSCKKEENQVPICKITSPDNGQEITVGTTVTIAVDAKDCDGNITEVRFYIDGVSKGSVSSFPYNYDWNTTGETTGQHTIKTTATDNNGGESSFEVTITLGSASTASFTATPTSGTAPLTINFTDQSSSNPTSWQWNFGDGNYSKEQNPVHTYYVADTFTVTLTATNKYGSNIKTKTDYIVVGNKVVADFSATPTCGIVPLTVNFTDQSSNSPTSWQWDFGDGETSTQQNPEHTYHYASTFTVTLTTTNESDSNTKTKTDYIVVNEVVADFTATPTSGTYPLTVNFTDQSINSPTSWDWDFGDGGNSTEQNPLHIYNNFGSYTVSLTVSNDYGSDNESKENYIYVNYGGGGNMEMIQVNGGVFQLNGTDVTISSFQISNFEITNAQYIEFLNDIGCNANGTYNDSTYGSVEYIDINSAYCAIDHDSSGFYFGGSIYAIRSDCPVIEVTWLGANAYCQWVSGRLPTEAEWEVAARGATAGQAAGTFNDNWAGTNDFRQITNYAWYQLNSNVQTHPVGIKIENELGLHDMSGNVYEWCGDWHGSFPSSNNNPTGPPFGAGRVRRGGSFNFDANDCKVAWRSNCDPFVCSSNIGFRLVIP